MKKKQIGHYLSLLEDTLDTLHLYKKILLQIDPFSKNSHIYEKLVTLRKNILLPIKEYSSQLFVNSSLLSEEEINFCKGKLLPFFRKVNMEENHEINIKELLELENKNRIRVGLSPKRKSCI